MSTVLYPVINAPDWVADALCAQTDPELFFPSKGGPTGAAKRVCAACPVRAQCLEAAVADASLDGIWGGTSERERRQMRKTAPVKAAA